MSTSRLCPVTICLLVFALQNIQGSLIRLQTSPDRVLNGLTSTLTLRCSLSDTAPSAGIIGRRRDVSQTTENMASVTSLILMKGGNDFASITPSQPAHVMDGSTDVGVSGSLTGTTGERGYLQVTLPNPGVNQTRDFMCEANAVSQSGHIVTFSTSTEISIVEPTTADLVAHIRDLETKVNYLEKENAELKTVVAFNARLDAKVNVSDYTTVVFDKVLENTGNGYDSKTGLFTCSVPGYYDISVSCTSENSKLHLDADRNSDVFLSLYGYVNDGDAYHSAANSAPVKLAKGDVVKIVNIEKTTLIRWFCHFSGYLLKMA